MTRSAAVKKLQCSLADFRRLCILKGIIRLRHVTSPAITQNRDISPRATKQKESQQRLDGSNVLLLHKGHRIPRARASLEQAARAQGVRKEDLKSSWPWRMEHCEEPGGQQTNLSTRSHRKGKVQHFPSAFFARATYMIIRYPTFIDAVRDIDDALCMIFLFASLPSNDRVSPQLIANCSRLAAEWQLYVMHSRSLRKVFLSIKGIYYQAEIMDQDVTWLVPYQFTQNVTFFLHLRVPGAKQPVCRYHQTLMSE